MTPAPIWRRRWMARDTSWGTDRMESAQRAWGYYWNLGGGWYQQNWWNRSMWLQMAWHRRTRKQEVAEIRHWRCAVSWRIRGDSRNKATDRLAWQKEGQGGEEQEKQKLLDWAERQRQQWRLDPGIVVASVGRPAILPSVSVALSGSAGFDRDPLETLFPSRSSCSRKEYYSAIYRTRPESVDAAKMQHEC